MTKNKQDDTLSFQKHNNQGSNENSPLPIPPTPKLLKRGAMTAILEVAERTVVSRVFNCARMSLVLSSEKVSIAFAEVVQSLMADLESFASTSTPKAAKYPPDFGSNFWASALSLCGVSRKKGEVVREVASLNPDRYTTFRQWNTHFVIEVERAEIFEVRSLMSAAQAKVTRARAKTGVVNFMMCVDERMWVLESRKEKDVERNRRFEMGTIRGSNELGRDFI